ncbi:MAG: 30S ribosomal protein S9 [Acidilobaceae archaeon]
MTDTILNILSGRIVVSSGKRKTAVAIATIRSGKGRVWVNRIPIEVYPVEVARLKVLEPILIAGDSIRNLVDINIKVRGGGFMSQAEAARISIARGLIEFFKCEEEDEACKRLNEISIKLKKLFEEYDRFMLSGDPRRTEPEKPMMYSARRRRQRSYR